MQLSPADVARALSILGRLKEYRENHPQNYYVKASHILQVVNQLPAPWHLSDSGLRELINWLADNKHPIGSCARGYWYITHSSEYDSALNFLRGRVAEIAERVRKMTEAKVDMTKRESSIFGTGVSA